MSIPAGPPAPGPASAGARVGDAAVCGPSPDARGTVRVLICDDSAVVRGALERLLAAEPDIRVTGKVAHGEEALAMLRATPRAQRPHVVLLDLEMPVMDGMTALPLILREPGGPAPAVIVASALTQRGAAAAMAALRSGAADYIPKPRAVAGGAGAGAGMADPTFRAELLAKVRGWARMLGGAAGRPPVAAGLAASMSPAPRPPTPGPAAAARLPRGPGLPPAAVAPPRGGAAACAPAVVAIGCSTGGPQALSALVGALGRGPLPVPVLVVQHMPAGFTTMLADHLNRLGGPPCAEAREGEPLLPGRIYVAPGDRHLLVEAAGSGLAARLSDAPPEHFCRPAVDPLLRSLAAACGGGRVLAAILTGMGHDGLEGCRAVAAAGGTVLAQDEASSVVWGMPGAVARAGLPRALLPPAAIAAAILEAVRGGGGAVRAAGRAPASGAARRGWA